MTKMVRIIDYPTCKNGFYKIPIINELGEIHFVNPCPECKDKCNFPAPEKLTDSILLIK